jgi:glycerol-3-phosphate O-acyltransferase/dihydroxyacetone phosphate acyltransferase
VIEFGTPISIKQDLVEKYRQGGPDKREACGKLLDTIYDALKSVTVNAGSYETLMVKCRVMLVKEQVTYHFLLLIR